MPRNIYPGKKLYENGNYFETAVSFKNIINHPTIQKIKKPDYQGSLNNDTVESLVVEFNKNPNFLRYKNKIVIGILNNTYYILDGQHRMEMVRQIGEMEEELQFCWYSFTTEQGMRELFTSINKDSYKNQWFINSDDFKQIKITEFNRELKTYCKEYFAKKKTEKGKIYTIEEFTEKLNELDFFNDSEKPALDYYKLIKEKNDNFCNLFDYTTQFEINKKSFYKDEYKNVENKIVMSLKNNNFLEWLKTEKKPIHKFTKNKKEAIPQSLRKKVWEEHFKTETKHKCPISWCDTILNNSIKNGWQAGHIRSEDNGGETKLENLKPICKSCNCEMGTKNWDTYDKI